MKYKITAIILSVFLAVTSSMYIWNFGASLANDISKNGMSFGAIKSAILRLRNNDAEYMPFEKAYINTNGAYHLITGKNFVNDTFFQVAKLENGYLTFAGNSKKEFETEPLVRKTDALNKYLERNNIGFLYVQAPEKVCRFDENILPTGIYSSNVDESVLLSEFEKNNINYIDIEAEIHSKNLNHYSMFYKTDHHWNNNAGFWANKLICDKLAKDYDLGIDSDLYSEELYKTEKHKDCFIGTQGSRVGLVFSPVDDIEFIYPTFETDLTISFDDEKRRGSFYNTMFSMEHFTEKAVLSDKDYVVYSGGDYALQTIINHKNPNGPKIVVIRDSFARVVTPYLSLTCSELHILDVRYFDDMSAAEYAVSIGADAVVVLYNPGMIVEPGAFDFTPEDFTE